MKILHCIGLHKEGGYSIYRNFKSIKYDKIYSDPRLKKKISKTLIIFYRFFIDLYLFFKLLKIKDKNISITYLSGTCPTIKTKAFSIVCFQNANIFYNKNVNFLDWFFSFDFIRYVNFQFFKNNADQWIVFSDISRNLLIDRGVKDYKIKNVNLFNDKINLKVKNNINKKYDFIYPASFMAHKNHDSLIKAIIILSKKKIYPRVLLTLTENDLSYTDYLDLRRKYKLDITFKYYKNIYQAYLKSRALIFPSLNETIGLPLIEAFKMNLVIISSNLPYTYQYFKPNLVFNAKDPEDIAQKMKFFLLKKKFTRAKFNFNNFITMKQFKKMI